MVSLPLVACKPVLCVCGSLDFSGMTCAVPALVAFRLLLERS